MSVRPADFWSRAARRGSWLLTLTWLAVGACNGRFDFDTSPSGGGGGDLSQAGSSVVGGSGGTPTGGASGGASGSGAVAGSAGSSSGGSTAGEVSGGSGGTMGSSDAGSAGEPGCGTGPACPSPLHCAAGACVECAADVDCSPYGLRRCDTTRHRCVACMIQSDCPDDSKCDSLGNYCAHECELNEGCPATAHGCDLRRNVCYQCDNDRECASSPNGPLCAVDRSGCVQCKSNTDCTGSQLCDALSGRCVACRDGRDCPSTWCDPRTHQCLPG